MFPSKVGSTEHSEDNAEWKRLLRKFGLNHGFASVSEGAVAVPSMEKEFDQRFQLTHSFSSARDEALKSCLCEVRVNVWGSLYPQLPVVLLQ